MRKTLVVRNCTTGTRTSSFAQVTFPQYFKFLQIESIIVHNPNHNTLRGLIFAWIKFRDFAHFLAFREN